MSKKEKVAYWIKSAEKDWTAVNHLFASKDYTHALFLGHLTVEKLLKAIYAKRHHEDLPRQI